jgi:tRNA1(Val) A37 N6-methylase TrmN6
MKQRSQLKGEDETLDSFYRGSILVLQKKEGYRFSVDAPLLADFVKTKRSDEILELGAGNGIISLLLSIKPFKHITAVEIQGSLADMARREDLLQYDPGKKFNVIFSNPPYIKKGDGHLSSSLEKSIAKHELKCDIFGIIEKTAELLKNKGRAYYIYLAKRKDDLFQALERSSLKITSIRFVCARKDSPPNLLLAECDFSSKKEAIIPPFILYDEDGHYTKEAEEIFKGRIQAEAD